jgi:hypothetical protein
MDHEDSDCELEVISFQDAYIPSQVIDHTSFQEFPIPPHIHPNSTSPLRYNYTSLLQSTANRTECHWNGTAITDYIPPILKTDSFITTHCKNITNNIKPLYNILEASNITEPQDGGTPLECSLVRVYISTPILVYLTISICYYQPMSNGALWTSQHRSHILVIIPRIATISLIGTKYTSFATLFIAVISMTSHIHHVLWTKEDSRKHIDFFQYITDQKLSLLLR